MQKARSKAGTPLVPTAMIAGEYTIWGSLDHTLSVASYIRNIQCPSDPLAQLLTGTGWPTIFGGAAYDVMVSVDSQLNGGDTVANFQPTAVVVLAVLTKILLEGVVQNKDRAA